MSSLKTSSVSGRVISSSSQSRAIKTSSSLSRGGRAMFLRAKYRITRNAATGQSKSEPFNSANIYAPPLLREMMIRGVPRSHLAIQRFFDRHITK